MKNFVVALIALYSIPTFAYEESISCSAKGKKTAQAGSSERLPTDAQLNFDLKVNGKKVTLTDVKGIVKVSYEAENGEELTDENSYVGHFDISSIKNNPDYKPRKYKNYVQFQDFNAAKTTGSEDGMWGNFLLEKDDTSDKFNARYIFQAGDHMGGTIDFTCYRE